MKGFVQDNEGLAIKNDEFRRVLYTAKRRNRESIMCRPWEEAGLGPVAFPDRDDPGRDVARRN
jgi:hypothetical protein